MGSFDIEASFFQSREEHFYLPAAFVGKKRLSRRTVGGDNGVVMLSEFHPSESQAAIVDIVALVQTSKLAYAQLGKKRISRTPVVAQAVFTDADGKRHAALTEVVKPRYAYKLSVGQEKGDVFGFDQLEKVLEEVDTLVTRRVPRLF